MKRKRSDDGSESDGCDYEVFLSFRGPDTRHVFTDFLNEFMSAVGIRVFLDDDELRCGEKIGEELARAIASSKVYIPIFSRGYASSAWCLRELALMVEKTRGSNDRKILPIFYDVGPADVKLRTDLFRSAIEGHRSRFDEETVGTWEAALQEVAQIKGWVLQANQRQGKLIGRIVQAVSRKLKIAHIGTPSHLIGIDERVEDIKDLLDCGTADVRYVVVHGMGGIGKTTLVSAVFNSISSQFQHCRFLENVRESSRRDGLDCLQEKLLPKPYYGSRDCRVIEECFRQKKVLLVLDDVDNREQLRKLAGGSDWFGPGSRILITTRDIRCVAIEGQKRYWDIELHNSVHQLFPHPYPAAQEGIYQYELAEMKPHHGLELFSRHAFGTDLPPPDYMSLSKAVVDKVGRLPLALEVIGSHLYYEKRAVWEDTLAKLKKVPYKQVLDTMMISYEALDDSQKQIFLDIACFFSGKEKTNAFHMWEASSDFFPTNDLNVLVCKSLVKIEIDNTFWMHDQLRDLGKEIVRQESRESPENRSRLWVPEDAFEIVKANKGTEKIVGINMGELSLAHTFTPIQLAAIPNLMFLELHGGFFVGNFENILSKLRWLCWKDCPSEFKATNLQWRNLAVLEISGADVKDEWDGWRGIEASSNLKVLIISNCNLLSRTPDLSACLNLEMLTLKSCGRLTEIDGSICTLKHLTYMEIRNCYKLRKLPQGFGSLTSLRELRLFGPTHPKLLGPKFQMGTSLCDLSSLSRMEIHHKGIKVLPEELGKLRALECLDLCFCQKMFRLPDSVWRLEGLLELRVSRTALRVLPDEIENLKNLKVLDLSFTQVRKLPASIGKLKKLEQLLAAIPQLEGEVPSEIGEMSSLKVLELSNSDICGLPATIWQINQLESLKLSNCHKLHQLPELPTGLRSLVFTSQSLEIIPDLSYLVNLVDLVLSDGAQLRIMDLDIKQTRQMSPLNLCWLPKLQNLQTLDLQFTRTAIVLPTDLGSLSRIKELCLYCPELQSLSRLPPNIISLTFGKFRFPLLWQHFSDLQNLYSIKLDNSELAEIQFDGLEQMKCLRRLEISFCVLLRKLAIPPSMNRLGSLVLDHCRYLSDIQGLEQLASLEVLEIDYCESLERIPDLSSLQQLKRLSIWGCDALESVSGVLGGDSQCLLRIQGCQHLPMYNGPYYLYVENIRPILS
ncbi:hypothetical protein MLD38_030657 [Melastoma candidum]|uniref:Uncharacterized protein n=2 Tax=Melastoma candidum TaxID=119954 RepID=A0ACB9MLV2_9MYRT|nr:hypothetical protein MLD38_030657 [Melastoma candidum]